MTLTRSQCGFAREHGQDLVCAQAFHNPHAHRRQRTKARARARSVRVCVIFLSAGAGPLSQRQGLPPLAGRQRQPLCRVPDLRRSQPVASAEFKASPARSSARKPPHGHLACTGLGPPMHRQKARTPLQWFARISEPLPFSGSLGREAWITPLQWLAAGCEIEPNLPACPGGRAGRCGNRR